MTTINERGYIVNALEENLKNYCMKCNYYDYDKDEYLPVCFADIKALVNNHIYECHEEGEKLVWATQADVYAALEVMKIAGILRGNMGDGYTLDSDCYDIGYYILNADEVDVLEEKLEGFNPKYCTVREWLNATAPKLMAKAAKRTAIFEAKLAKREAKRKAEEKAYWDSWDEEEAA